MKDYMMKKTLIIGASENTERYAFKAAKMLKSHGHEIVLIGIKTGEIDGEEILIGKPDIGKINTVTLYINQKNQKDWYDYIINLKPQRVIFNPGTENTEFEKKLLQSGIEPVEACTLVLLSIGKY